MGPGDSDWELGLVLFLLSLFSAWLRPSIDFIELETRSCFKLRCSALTGRLFGHGHGRDAAGDASVFSASALWTGVRAH